MTCRIHGEAVTDACPECVGVFLVWPKTEDEITIAEESPWRRQEAEERALAHWDGVCKRINSRVRDLSAGRWNTPEAFYWRERFHEVMS